MIPQKIFENHSSSCARPSSGNSTKSASGFSSNIKENCFASFVQFVMTGVIFRKILNPIYEESKYGQEVYYERWTAISASVAVQSVEHVTVATYLRDCICCLSEIDTSLGAGLGKKILNKTHSNVVSHLVQLLVDLHIVTFIVIA